RPELRATDDIKDGDDRIDAEILPVSYRGTDRFEIPDDKEPVQGVAQGNAARNECGNPQSARPEESPEQRARGKTQPDSGSGKTEPTRAVGCPRAVGNVGLRGCEAPSHEAAAGNRGKQRCNGPGKADTQVGAEAAQQT